MKNGLWVVLGLLLSTSAVLAQPNRYALTGSKYQITEEERNACQNDAVMFCSAAYPDEDALLACMKTVRPQLTQSCRVVFEAGMRRRHIEF
ncbi:hypothetical protein P7D22_09585 [Lichenihabitans sp. Uapishka_5]|uniref:hypothetical protein n=1 Tax=Lichenihabitans sp. Uapishka_5 TaxID=3037302 RepID=UPI0029E819F0|nr:hypothetical protein [Lichenihabitans sp. Uapishka_5]MDX7951420.1 hypothetical protein [Lichenihabitans sp. Uapishka_5]